jgi:hypothetical protein
MQKGDIMCAVKKNPAGKIIPVIESIPSKKTGNFVTASRSTKHEGVWGRKTASVVWWLACWPLVPEFAGSIPTEAVGFFPM